MNHHDDVTETRPHPHRDGRLFVAMIAGQGCRPLSVCAHVGVDHRGPHIAGPMCIRPVSAITHDPATHRHESDGELYTRTTTGDCEPAAKSERKLREDTVYVGVDGYQTTLAAGDTLTDGQLGTFAPMAGSVWRDRHGDVWTVGADRLMMRTPEMMPHHPRRVEAKSGPLVPLTATFQPEPGSRWLDADGDTWTTEPDGWLRSDSGSPEANVVSPAVLERTCGPLQAVAPVDDVRLCTPTDDPGEKTDDTREFMTADEAEAHNDAVHEAKVRAAMDALIVELLERATGRNGSTLLADVREFGMDVVLAHPLYSAPPQTRDTATTGEAQ